MKKILLFVICCSLFLISCSSSVDGKVQNEITDPITFVVKDASDTNVVPLQDINTTPVVQGYKSEENTPLDIVATFTLPEGLTLGSALFKNEALPSTWYSLNDMGNEGLPETVSVSVAENADQGSNVLKIRITCNYPANVQGVMSFTFTGAFDGGVYKGTVPVIPFDIVKAS